MRLTESYIQLKGLRFHARHGVLPQEHVCGNDYTVDLRLGTDISRAAETDDINDTLNYAEVYAIVKEEMEHESCLIEHVAHRICQRLGRHFKTIDTIDIVLTKHNPPMGADCEGAAVELHYRKMKDER